MKHWVLLVMSITALGVMMVASWGTTTAQTNTVYAEAINPNANVREQPTIEGLLLGQIQPGERYVVRGKRFEWLLIEYPLSPINLAWVHQGVVSIIGDLALVPEIDPALIDLLITPSPAPTLAETLPPTSTQPPAASPTPTMPRVTFTPPAATPTPLRLADFETTAFSEPAAESERRLDALEAVYIKQAVVLWYGSNPIILDPTSIGFGLDREATRAALDLAQPFQINAAPLATNLSSDLLRAYLEDLNARYTAVVPALPFDNGSLTFGEGEPVWVLDIDASEARIIEALNSSTNRVVDLPLVQVPNMEGLERAVLNYLASRGISYRSPNSVVSVYIRDLTTGAEMGIQEHVPHSANSTAKVGVIANTFRYTNAVPNTETTYRMAAAVICSSNADANLLMSSISGGNFGIQSVNDTLCRAGAVDTRVDRYFWIGAAGEGGVPANYYDSAGSPTCSASNSDTSVQTQLDPLLQTTAADMGHLLDQIYQCAVQNQGLVDVFPSEITQTECQWMIELLEGTRFYHMAELGVPSGVTIAHKVGYGGETAGDVGIVFSPAGAFAYAVYIWDDQLDNFDNYALGRWNAMGEVVRVAYNFFNRDAPMLAPNIPANPYGGAACVLPNDWTALDLNNINAGRFDSQGVPLASACYDWPQCRAFDNWGR